MRKGCKSPQCCDNAYSARIGVLFGVAGGVLYQVYRAFTHQIPESIYTHVFGEIGVSALGGATLFAAVSAICNWFNQSR
jgi:hypothetical protein